MKCYNVPVFRSRQAVPAIAAGLRASGGTRRPHGRSRRELAVGGLAAALLHGAVAMLAMIAIHRAAVPSSGEGPVVAMVFAPSGQQAKAEPVATAVPQAASAPRQDAPSPATMDVPVADKPPPEPVPPALEPQPPKPPEPEQPPVAVPPPAPQAKVPPPPPVATRPRERHPALLRRQGATARPAPAKRTPSTMAAQNPDASPSGQSATSEAAPAGAAMPIAAGWQHALAAWLAAHKAYPEAARQRGEEGVALLRFTVERSGRVLDVALVRSSGSPVLDAAAEAMVRNATMPAFPADMTQDKVTVTVQIHYSLAD